MKRWIGLLAALAVATALAVLGTTPPSPREANISNQGFSAARAMEDVRRIGGKPHPTGASENARVRAYLAQRLKALGLEVREATHPLPANSRQKIARWSKGELAPTSLVNVVGVLPGKDRKDPAVMLMAHYDTVWSSPGAADDSAGVAAILETVRAIKQRGQARRDLIVVLTDAEELGLSGAAAFFASDPLRSQVGMAINLESRGGGGRTTLFQLSPGNGEAIAVYRNAVSGPGASSLAAYIYSVLPNDTDLTAGLRLNYAGYNFAFIGRPALYHSPKSTPDSLDQGALQDMGGQVLALSDALLRADRLPGKASDVVFFDVFGLFLVSYPAWLGLAMVVAIVIGLGNAMRDCRGKQVAEGLVRMLLLLAATAVLLYLLNLLSGAGQGRNYYDRLAAIPLLTVMVACAGLGMALLLFRTEQIKARRIGALLPLLAIGVLAQALAPTAAYVVLLPVLLTALAMFLKGRGERIGAVTVAGVVLGYELYLGYFTMQGVGPTMPSVEALPLALAVAAVLPLWPGLGRRAAHAIALSLLSLGLAVALYVRFDPMADTVPAYSLEKNVPILGQL